MQQLLSDPFNYKSLRCALKNWHNLKQLNRHPLVELPLLQSQPYNSQSGGLALRHLLRQGVESLRPNADVPDFAHQQWRYYTILKEQYINGRRAAELREELGVSESGYFADQRQALKRLGNWLREVSPYTQQEPAKTAVFTTSSPEPEPPPIRLPQQLTPFIGRHQERQQIANLLAQPDCRLVSLIGPGGMGKSRLSIQAAHEQAAHFKHGVFFIPLAALEQAAYMVTAVANGIGLNLDSQTSHQEQLFNYLRHKEMLLLLDNLEHLLENVSFIQALLQHVAGIKIIATSRERLNIRGEWVIPISGMKIPDTPLDTTAQPQHEDLTHYSAVQLFLGAAERQRGHPLPPADIIHAARICQLVQGMPLGIELAASWVHLIPCHDIATEIERNLDFLASSFRDLPQRHQSLRAVFNHSWNLLTETEQITFCRLCLFGSSFTREAAEQIAGATLPILHALNNKSLLSRRPSGRYGVHTLLRQYAAEQLRQWPNLWTQTHTQHSQFFLHLLQTETAVLQQGGLQSNSLLHLKKELEEIRLAWRWASDHNLTDLLQQAAEPLFTLYVMLNRLQEGEEAFAQLVTQQAIIAQAEAAPPNPLILGLAYAFQGRFNLMLGHQQTAQNLCQQSLLLVDGEEWPRERALISTLAIEANLTEPGMEPETLYETAVTYYTQTGDEWGLATAHFNLVAHYRAVGSPHHYEAEQRLLQKSYHLRQKIGDQWGLAKCLNNLGIIAYERGNYTEAEQYARQGLQLHRQLNNQLGVAYSLNHLAQTMSTQGDYIQAQQYYEESLAIFEAFGDRREIAICLDCIGYINYLMDNIAEAKHYYEESLLICQKMDDIQGIAWSFHNLGDIARRQGELHKAQQFYQKSHEMHLQKEPLDWGRVVSLIKLGRTTLALGNHTDALTLLHQALHLATQTERFREALDALYSIAHILWHWQQAEDALRCLALIQAHHATAKKTLDAAQQDWATWQQAIPAAAKTAVLQQATTMSITTCINWLDTKIPAPNPPTQIAP